MTTDCEEVSHEAMHDDLPVREYRVRDDDDGERYSLWLCDACAHELEECGVDLRGVETKASS